MTKSIEFSARLKMNTIDPDHHLCESSPKGNDSQCRGVRVEPQPDMNRALEPEMTRNARALNQSTVHAAKADFSATIRSSIRASASGRVPSCKTGT